MLIFLQSLISQFKICREASYFVMTNTSGILESYGESSANTLKEM